MTVSSLPRLTGLLGRLCRHGVGAGILCVLLGSVTTTGCNKADEKKDAKQVVQVVVTEPITDYSVTDYQDFTGRLAAYKTIDIKARASGYAVSVPFKEGDLVQDGDLLYLIDQRPYKTALESAAAQVELAQANIELAKRTYDRDQIANRAVPGSVSQQQLDQDLAQQKVAEATLRVAKSGLENARINLAYTEVRAPVTGRISYRYVDPGNDVMADMTLLTTIVTIDPIYAYFDVDERTYLDIQKRKTQHVLMRLANENHFAHVGDVDFVDNRVNANAGTMRMRGIFNYMEVHDPSLVLASCGVSAKLLPREAIEKLPALLTPGLFCRARVPIGESYKAVLVPDAALQTDQGRKFVYVVTPKKDEHGNVVYKTKKNDQGEEQVVNDANGKPVPVYRAEYRQVETGQQIGELRVIKSGLATAKGAYVITKGQQRVRQNSKDQEVEITIEKPPKIPESPLGLLGAAEAAEKFHQQTAPPPPGGTGLLKPGTTPEKPKKDG
jgi:RND family efflux transporter MFP subunit